MILRVRHCEPGGRSNLYMVEKAGYIYLMTNQSNAVLYTGVTHDLKRRIYEHKCKIVPGFTRKYNISKLVYYEVLDSMINAITREKQIKAGPRKKKMQMIKSINPDFKDLYDQI